VGEHINTKHNGLKRHKKGFNESADVHAQRAARVSFKTYMQNLEDELLEQELTDKEYVLERGTTVGEETIWTEIETFPTEDEAEDVLEKYEESELHAGEQFRIREV